MAKQDRLFRYIQVDQSAIDRDARTIALSFSSESPAIQRADDGLNPEVRRSAGLREGELYVEVLDHSPENVDLSLLNNSGAFLDEHDERSHIGVVVRSEVVDAIGRATVKLGTDTLAQTRFEQMASGLRPHISAGYKPTKYLGDATLPNGRKAKRFAWKALEISSVAIPADPTIGVARSYQDLPQVDSTPSVKSAEEATKQNMRTGNLLLDPTPAEGGGGTAVIDPKKIRADEQKRVREITTISDTLIKNHPQCADKIRSLTTECISSDVEVGAYQIRALTEALNAKPAEQLTMARLGMSQRDQQNYSVGRAIRSALGSKNGMPTGLELEAHTELSNRCKAISFEGIAIPFDAMVRAGGNGRMRRDLNVTTFSQGGATVPTELVPIIEILRNRMVMDKVGVVVMGGLEGNVAIPRQTGAATAYSLPESATLTKSTQALDQILLAPHRVGAWNDYTRQLLIQSSLDVDNFIRDDLMKVVALKWDYLILNGQGAGSEALGITNTPGIASILFGGSATFAKLVSFETALAVLNADAGSMAYITTPAVRGALKSAAKLLTGATTVAATPLWETTSQPLEGIVNGYPAWATNQVLNNQVVFGNYSDVILGLYGGYDVIINPYSRDTDAAVRVTVNTFGDVATRHAASFAVSADAGNQ